MIQQREPVAINGGLFGLVSNHGVGDVRKDAFYIVGNPLGDLLNVLAGLGRWHDLFLIRRHLGCRSAF